MLVHISKIPYHATIMIQLGSKLWFIRPRHMLGLIAMLMAGAMSSCASMPSGKDKTYTIDKNGVTSDGAIFVPGEGNVSHDSAGRYYYKNNAGTAYQSITTTEGQTCYTQNAGTAFENVVCY